MKRDLGIIVPAYNEEMNLEALYQAIQTVFDGEDIDWKIIIVDDHSTDSTPHVIARLAAKDKRVCGVRLARNTGTHNAILCGMKFTCTDMVAMMAADLQDPPEVLLEMVKKMRDGYHVVWAVRSKREGISFFNKLFSRLFYAIMRRILKRNDIPVDGADFFLIDQVVAQMLRGIREANVNVFALIQWAGFRQTTLPYVKKQRRSGISGWGFSRKFKLFVDSIVGFSFFPIRAISAAGLLTAFIGFGYALFVLIYYFWQDVTVQGWSSLIITILIMGGLNLAAMGVLGEYIWRALDEIRGRPIHTIEVAFGLDRTVDGNLDIPHQTPIVSNANMTDQV